MTDFHHLIRSEEKNQRGLHEAVHAAAAAYREHGRTPAAREAWQRAAARFHGYESMLEPWLRHVETDALSADSDLRDFVLAYLEADPDFFRSGYIKQRLMKKMKSARLEKRERARLSAIVIDALQRPEVRAFKDYCRLAAAQCLSDVRDAALAQSESDNEQLALRAGLLLARYESRSA